MERCLIIAEAGVNHNGELARALALVDVAAQAGADVVKFQTFSASALVNADAPKAAYQQQTTDAAESQLDMLRRLELDHPAHETLRVRCHSRGIRFLSTPFDLPSLNLLARKMNLPVLKLPSGEITNGPFLLAAAQTGKKLILSTGMSTLDEVANALAILAFGMLHPELALTLHEYRGREAASFQEALHSAEGQGLLRERVTLLHCTTEYPAPYAEVHLRAMSTLKERFGLPVGLSDHTPGIAVALAAVALGAVVVEKHFTLDRTLPGPDHLASLEPEELRALVAGIRAVEAALGTADKGPTPSELKNRPIARKSLFAARAIAAGEPFSADNIRVARPGTGVSPLRYWEYLEQKALRDYKAGEALEAL